jgi:hypothetical protein
VIGWERDVANFHTLLRAVHSRLTLSHEVSKSNPA